MLRYGNAMPCHGSCHATSRYVMLCYVSTVLTKKIQSQQNPGNIAHLKMGEKLSQADYVAAVTIQLGR